MKDLLAFDFALRVVLCCNVLFIQFWAIRDGMSFNSIKLGNLITINEPNVQSSLCIFAQKYLRKCEDAYFILQNKYGSVALLWRNAICDVNPYLSIYKDSFGMKILRDDCALIYTVCIIKRWNLSIRTRNSARHLKMISSSKSTYSLKCLDWFNPSLLKANRRRRRQCVTRLWRLNWCVMIGSIFEIVSIHK